MNRRGFTLIELIVTVAIIGVLAALVLGSVSLVQQRGDAAQCSANLRGLAAANLAYAAENAGRYVFAQDVSNTVRWHGEREDSDGKFDPQKGPLAPYLGADGRVKVCPTLRRAPVAEASFNEEGAGGYGYNAAYIGGVPGDAFTPERFPNVARPGRTVMFTDTALPNAKGVQEYPFSEPWQWTDYAGRLRGALTPSVHFRHAGRANVAWCDGHVTAEEPTRLGGTNRYGGSGAKWLVGWFGPEDDNGYWNPRRTPAQ